MGQAEAGPLVSISQDMVGGWGQLGLGGWHGDLRSSAHLRTTGRSSDKGLV